LIRYLFNVSVAAVVEMPSPQLLFGMMPDHTPRHPTQETHPAVDRADSTDADRDDLLAARGGDEGAARRIVARHGKSMIRTAWRILGSYGSRDGDDVVQDAFIASLTTDALPSGDVGAWLRAIAARKALDELRRKGRRVEQPLPDNEGEGPQPEASDDLGGHLDVLTVRQALATLSPTDRAVLTLVDLEGWPMAEAAKMLGLTYVAIKLRASRARRKLAGIIRSGRPAGSKSR
jgi:RNA polymerase sigma-70 factor (ECF subfamily)